MVFRPVLVVAGSAGFVRRTVRGRLCDTRSWCGATDSGEAEQSAFSAKDSDAAGSDTARRLPLAEPSRLPRDGDDGRG